MLGKKDVLARDANSEAPSFKNKENYPKNKASPRKYKHYGPRIVDPTFAMCWVMVWVAMVFFDFETCFLHRIPRQISAE